MKKISIKKIAMYPERGRINLRFTPGIKKEIIHLAKKNCMTVTAYMRQIVDKHLKNLGI